MHYIFGRGVGGSHHAVREGKAGAHGKQLHPTAEIIGVFLMDVTTAERARAPLQPLPMVAKCSVVIGGAHVVVKMASRVLKTEI